MKKTLALSAALLLSLSSLAYASDNISHSYPLNFTKNLSQNTFAKAFTWHDICYSVSEGDDKLIFTFNDGKYTEKHDITGYRVSNAEIGDINGDDQPELFVYLKSKRPDHKMKLIGYSSNNGKSMSQVYLPEPADSSEAYTGYRGFDEMAMVENSFCRRFPVIEEADGKAYMNGMLRQVDYKLVDGEACRRLEIEKYYDYPLFEGK